MKIAQIKQIVLVAALAVIGNAQAMQMHGGLFKTIYLHNGTNGKVFVDSLEKAISGGNVAVLAQYISTDSDANARDQFRETLLHKAAASGNLKAVQFLLGRGARINVINETGDTPLHEATMRTWPQHAEVAEFLLSKGANPSAEDRTGRTPLHFAARNNERLVSALLAAGAKVNVKNDNGLTPLDAAYEWNAIDGEERLQGVIDMLRAAGARLGKELK